MVISVEEVLVQPAPSAETGFTTTYDGYNVAYHTNQRYTVKLVLSGNASVPSFSVFMSFRALMRYWNARATYSESVFTVHLTQLEIARVRQPSPQAAAEIALDAAQRALYNTQIEAARCNENVTHKAE